MKKRILLLCYWASLVFKVLPRFVYLLLSSLLAVSAVLEFFLMIVINANLESFYDSLGPGIEE